MFGINAPGHLVEILNIEPGLMTGRPDPVARTVLANKTAAMTIVAQQSIASRWLGGVRHPLAMFIPADLGQRIMSLFPFDINFEIVEAADIYARYDFLCILFRSAFRLESARPHNAAASTRPRLNFDRGFVVGHR